MKEYPWGKGTPKWIIDATLNDSDKSFTVPEGKVWDVRSVEANLACTATVGNRVLQCQITNGTDVIHTFKGTGVVTASQYGAIYCGVGAGAANTSARRLITGNADANVASQDFIASMILPAGYVIRVRDHTGVDAAADDLTVVLHYVEYDA